MKITGFKLYKVKPRWLFFLGIEIDEQAVEQAAAQGHLWRNPVWRHEDGSVAEW